MNGLHNTKWEEKRGEREREREKKKRKKKKRKIDVRKKTGIQKRF